MTYIFFKPQEDGSAYDIAIIKLYSPISFNEKVGPICLAKSNTRDHDITVFTAGWGLRYAEEDSRDPMVCNSKTITVLCSS